LLLVSALPDFHLRKTQKAFIEALKVSAELNKLHHELMKRTARERLDDDIEDFEDAPSTVATAS
jgi:hypothetical protein